jgi:hypothetical protein
MRRSDPPSTAHPIGRRALLATGLAAAALAATPAGACTVTGTPRRPAAYYGESRARAIVEAILEAANKGEQATGDELLALEDMQFFVGAEPELFTHDFVPRWLTSNGHRDDHPAALETMRLWSRRGRRSAFLLGVGRSIYLLAQDDGGSCFMLRDEGYSNQVEAWLFRFDPDAASTMRRVPEFDDEAVPV